MRSEILGDGDYATAPNGTDIIHRVETHSLIADRGTASISSIVLNMGQAIPYVAHVSNASKTVAAWSGSSKFVFLLTADRDAPSMIIAWNIQSRVETQIIDLKPLIEYGYKILPWATGSVPHDSVLELQSSDGNSVDILYYRAKFPKRFVVRVNVKIENGSNSAYAAIFNFGSPKWIEKWDEQLPSLKDL